MNPRSLAVVLVLCASRLSLASEPADALAAARGSARGRLMRPGCRMILSSYTDSAGRTLKENLEALDMKAESLLGGLSFQPAPAGSRACAAPSNVFFTTPGSRVVFVCGSRPEALQASEPRLLTALVLHEMLHSIGLGENPPSPSQITARVMEWCR